MTNKLKCPFCGEELDWCLSCPLPTMSCPNHNCKAYNFLMTQNCWQELIKTIRDLEQSEKCCSAWEIQALDYKSEVISLTCKLVIARDALYELWEATHYDTNGYMGKTIQAALKRIEKKGE